ncbi:hypothetical protein NDU88_002509 [Pleurodeles waltl]|uniref:Uncharacterized protein n=1 Tax=Pleurodeles waltl TaxID=8319 RepID=A0AAV7KSB9_PLEWA|nr:hypothetical protein NDU88_002509 [Pleurodeles waltl]
MAHGVEGSREVQEDEGGCFSVVHQSPDVVGDCDEGSFCAVVGSKSRLRRVERVVSLEKGGQLFIHSLLDDLGREGGKRDGAEVLQVFGISRGFFQEGVDFRVFPALGEGG